MLKPTVVTKGVSKWSINPDDNATADEKINWQEGQPPSTVNNSARMMMARIKEQHILDQANVSGKFGNKIKDITADSYKIIKHPGSDHWTIEFEFKNKLTQDEYNDYSAGKLYLLLNLVAPNIKNNATFMTWDYNDLISISLVFIVDGIDSRHAFNFKLNFFGIEQINTVISFHELGYFVNSSTLHVGDNNFRSTNYVALPMERTYVNSVKLSGVKPYDLNLQQWYYISPIECIVTQCMNFYNATVNQNYGFSLGNFDIAPQILQITRQNPGIKVYLDRQPNDPATSYGVYYAFTDGDKHQAICKVLLTGSPTELKDYPMSLTPKKPSNPPTTSGRLTSYTSIYPLIV